MYDLRIKLIDKDTDISSLKMSKYDWDLVIKQGDKIIPYQVVRIEGYIHSIGGKRGINDLWAYPRNEEPTYENLIEYSGDKPCCWGYRYTPYNYIRHKHDESEIFTSGGVMITRNGEDFYFCRGGIKEAEYLIKDLDDHPLELDTIGFDMKMIGRKVWWRSEPAVITRYIKGQACVILKPDGIEKFTIPAEYRDDDIDYYEEPDVKTDIFDKHINWFRYN